MSANLIFSKKPTSPTSATSPTSTSSREFFANDGDILKWVIESGECNSYADIDKKFRYEETDKNKAKQAYKVWADPKSIFAGKLEDGKGKLLREDMRKLRRLAAYCMDPINPEIEDIETAKKIMDNLAAGRSDLHGMKSTSKSTLGSLTIKVNASTVLRFVQKNPDLDTIQHEYFDSIAECEAAERIYEMLYTSKFAALRETLSEEERVSLAKVHAITPLDTEEKIQAELEKIRDPNAPGGRPSVYLNPALI